MVPIHTRKSFKKAFKEYKKKNKVSSYEKDLVNYYIEKFMLMFNQPSYDEATKSLNWFIKEFDNLPNFIQNQLQKKVIPYFKTFTLHLTDDNVYQKQAISAKTCLEKQILNTTNVELKLLKGLMPVAG